MSLLELRSSEGRAQCFAVRKFAMQHRIPLAIVGGARYLDAGGLLTYGPSFDQYPGLTARCVDRILRGANPAKLVIEQPAKFDLGISLVAAKMLGSTFRPRCSRAPPT